MPYRSNDDLSMSGTLTPERSGSHSPSPGLGPNQPYRTMTAETTNKTLSMSRFSTTQTLTNNTANFHCSTLEASESPGSGTREKSVGYQLRDEEKGSAPAGGQQNEDQLGKEEELEREKINSWTPWRRRQGWRGWMNDDIPTGNFVPALAVQAFATGLLDATTYADFMTFASMQTGNTILLTVSIIGTVPVLIELSAVSLASFILACMIFGHLGHYFGTRRRYWLLISTLCQTLFLVAAAILVSSKGPKITQVKGRHEWVVLALYASMSGMQVTLARQSGSAEIPNGPLTTSYVDLMADKYLFKGFKHPKAGPRNRRVGYIVLMVIGGLAGSCIHRFGGSWEVVVVTIGLKVLGVVQLAFAKGDW